MLAIGAPLLLWRFSLILSNIGPPLIPNDDGIRSCAMEPNDVDVYSGDRTCLELRE